MSERLNENLAKTRAWRARACAALCAAAALVAPPLRAADFSGSATLGDATISFTNVAATNWVNGELVLQFTNVNLSSSFTLPGYAVARVLAVGGGGAGGSGINDGSASAKIGRGVGGGGGAGGLIDTNSLVLADGVYSVKVGAGGEPGDDESGAAGGDGGDSSLVFDSADVLRAYGGGGGGANSEGSGTRAGVKNIGSGGGGSASYSSGTVAQNGGEGTTGQGHAGGKGTAGRTAGGGGGAGGAGSDGATMNAGAAGGAGLQSDIMGSPAWYAAGGGSGSRTGTVGAGGSGIGGSGGGGTSGTGTLATPGTRMTGSGGGGGTLVKAGAAGGDGIVVVRIAAALAGPTEKPGSTNVVYDGAAHVLVAKTLAYSVYRNAVEVESVSGTMAGTYAATVKLNDGFKWSDGTDDDLEIALVIEKATVVISDLSMPSWTEKPSGADLPSPSCTVNVAGANPTYTYGADESGADASAAKPTAPGTYYVFATVLETANWSGATAHAPFRIYEQPSAIFEDHVDVTFDAYTPGAGDPEALTNFPYRLVLSTESPVGFDYVRAGATGENICFADADGNTLSHRVVSWDPAGESVVYVLVPRLDGTERTITLFWKEADGKTAPAYDPDPVFETWPKTKADGFANKPAAAFGVVTTDGK